MRRLVVAIVVLVALALAADRAAVAVAERRIADRVQTSQGLDARPSVAIAGFPFLTQAIRGRYQRIDVGMRGLQRGDLRLARVDVRLTGVTLPPRAALSGRVGELPVAAARAQALLAYADITRAVDREGMTVAAAGDRLRVRGTVRLFGQEVPAAALATVAVRGSRIRVRPSEIEVGGQRLPVEMSDRVADRLTFAIGARGLPFGLQLSGVRVTPAGLVATASGRGLVLRAA